MLLNSFVISDKNSGKHLARHHFIIAIAKNQKVEEIF
jgi:hypothetical protein